MGAIGGLLGCALGSSATVIVCISQGWSSIFAGWWIPAAAVIGLGTGVVSALIPALIAAKQDLPRPSATENAGQLRVPRGSAGILDFMEGLNKGGEDRSKRNSCESGDPP